MALQVQRSGLTGWYYRVLETGFIEKGNELLLVDRLSPEWTIRRLWRDLYIDTMNVDELTGMSRLGHLPESWKAYAHKRIASCKVLRISCGVSMVRWTTRAARDHRSVALGHRYPPDRPSR